MAELEETTLIDEQTETGYVKFDPYLLEVCASPELQRHLRPPGTLAEALDLARSYQPGSQDFEYLKLHFPEIDQANLTKTIEILIERTKLVFGEKIAYVLELILNGGESYDSLPLSIYNRMLSKSLRTTGVDSEAGRLKSQKEEIVNAITFRICQAARLMLYVVSYDPYPDRDKQWFGCPVNPHEFLTCIIFTALNTPLLRRFDSVQSTRKQVFTDNYLSTLAYHSSLTSSDSAVVVEAVLDTIQTRTKLEHLRDNWSMGGELREDNLFGALPGNLLKLKDEERMELLSHIRHAESLTAIAVDTITTLTTEELIEAMYKGDEETVVVSISSTQTERLIEEHGRGVTFIEKPIYGAILEARLAFFEISILSQGWIDGVLIDYVLDESLHVMCPYKYHRAKVVTFDAMAFNVEGHQVETGPWTNENVVLTWAIAIYIQRLSQLFLQYSDTETQNTIQILGWVAARPKGLYSQFAKSLDLGTEFPPHRNPLNYLAWRNHLGGYRDPNMYSFDMMGTILVLSFPPTNEGITHVNTFFQRMFDACPYTVELYTHFKYAKATELSLYFSIHRALVVSSKPLNLRQHKTYDVNVVELHLPGEAKYQAAYFAQHVAWAFSKLAIDTTRTLAQIYNDLSALVFIYARMTGVSPQRAVELVNSFRYPFTVTFKSTTITEEHPTPVLRLREQDQAPLRGGLIFDILATQLNTSISYREIIALVRCAPSVKLVGRTKGEILLCPPDLYLPPAYLLYQKAGDQLTKVVITTDHKKIVEAMRASEPTCLGKNATQQKIVNKLIDDLVTYFRSNGEEWFYNILRQNPGRLLHPIQAHFRGKPEDDVVKRILISLDKLSDAQRVLGIVLPIAHRCAKYLDIVDKPATPIIDQSELINLITIGSSVGQTVEEILGQNLLQQIKDGYISASFLYTCAMIADRLYTGTGDRPSEWVKTVLIFAQSKRGTKFRTEYERLSNST